MSIRKPAIGVALFLVVCLVLTWIVYVTLQRSVSGETRNYSASFTDVSGLKVGDDVRMAGVRVGRVDKIELNGKLADVSFKIQRDQLVFGNTTASITYQNIVGQRYLGLALGDHNDPRPIRSGGHIPVSRTEPSFDISNLLNGFEPLFTVLDPKQVDNITSALITALQGDTGSIATLISETSALAEQFTGKDDLLGQVITNLTGVVDNLARQSGDLQTVITSTRDVFTGLERNRDQLFSQVDAISTTVSRAAEVFAGAQPQVNEFIARPDGFAGHFVDNSDEFGFLAWNLPLLLKGLGRITETGYVSAYACNVTVSLLPGLQPIIPAIVAAATPGGTIQQTQKCR